MGGFAGAIRKIVGWPIRWCADRLDDWRAVRQLRELDGYLLRDVGLTAADAQRATHRRDRGAQDPKGMPTWPTIS